MFFVLIHLLVKMNQQKIQIPVGAVERWFNNLGRDDKEEVVEAIRDGDPLRKWVDHFLLHLIREI